jgi:hypothetical protein
MGFLGMPRSEGAAHATEARAGVQAPLALLAASCILLGILPTFVIPAIDRAVVPITHMSACAALVPPFFNVDSQRQEHLPVKFVAEFHDLGAQVGGRVARTRSRCPPSRRAKPGRVCNVDLVYGCRLCHDPCCRLHRLPIIVPPSTTQARSGLGWRVAPPLAGDNLYGSGILEPVRVIFEAILQPAAGEDSVEAVAKHFRAAIKRNRTEVHIVDRLALDPLIASMGVPRLSCARCTSGTSMPMQLTSS